MRVITNRRLIEFAQRHPAAGPPLQAWRKTMELAEICLAHGIPEGAPEHGSMKIVGDV